MSSRRSWRIVSLLYLASHASVGSTTYLCRSSFSLLSMPFLAMRLLIEHLLGVRLRFLSSWALSACSVSGLFLGPSGYVLPD